VSYKDQTRDKQGKWGALLRPAGPPVEITPNPSPGDFWGAWTQMVDYDTDTAPMIPARDEEGRHTYRRTFTGTGMDITMPSMAAITRWRRAHPGAEFQIPVQITTPQGTSMLSATIVRARGGRWAVHLVGDGANVVSEEAVRACLEGRRAVDELETGRLLREHRRRLLLEGAGMRPVASSSWVRRIGWQDGVLAVDLNGRLYGYRAPRQHYDNMVAIDEAGGSVGAYYNRHIKRQATPTWVKQCPKCGLVFLEKRGHQCPVAPAVGRPVDEDGRPLITGTNLHYAVHGDT